MAGERRERGGVRSAPWVLASEPREVVGGAEAERARSRGAEVRAIGGRADRGGGPLRRDRRGADPGVAWIRPDAPAWGGRRARGRALAMIPAGYRDLRSDRAR